MPYRSRETGFEEALFSSQWAAEFSSSACSGGEHDVGIILALLYDKGPRPGFFLQTKQSQGLSISRTPGDTQQKAWGSALIFRGPFSLVFISLDIQTPLQETFSIRN
jgi:hypothetical protein